MNSLYLIFVLQLIAVTTGSSKNDQNQKTLIMLEFEPSQPDERSKRSSNDDESERYVRQAAQVPPEYLGLLQQLSAQRDQAAGGQPQQHLIQQLAVAREGSRPPAAARYVLSQDGRLLQENVGLQALGQPQQQFQFAGFPQPQPQPQQPQAPQPGRPIISPELAEFSRQQTRLQQDYHDAPIRAQIAGLTTRTQQRPVQPQPGGPGSQAPQVFLPPAQAQDPRLRAALQSGDPSAIYAALPADTQALLQQQVAQQLAQQASVGVDARALFAQTQAARQGQPQPLQGQPQILLQPQPQIQLQPQPQPEAPQQLVYQQQPTFSGRRPISVAPSSQAQLLPQQIQQQLPQQYLIETTRPQQGAGGPQPQFDLSQFQYLQGQQLVQQEIAAQSQQQPQPQPQPQPDYSQLLQPSGGRGLFTPVKPSRSSIYVSRQTSTPKPFGLSVEEVVNAAPSNQKLPTVRLPPPSGQRPLTRSELNALINAGFSVTPVPGSESDSEPSNYLKSKRQQPLINQERKNHVVYQNHQDGVQYQYSPGSSMPFRTRKSAGDLKSEKLYKSSDIDRSDNRQVVTYVLALDDNNSNNKEESS